MLYEEMTFRISTPSLDFGSLLFLEYFVLFHDEGNRLGYLICLRRYYYWVILKYIYKIF